MNVIRRSALVAITAGFVLSMTAPAIADEIDITREYREVNGAGLFTTCPDGTPISFASLSKRDYTTWLRDGVAVRELRHITFDGTLTDGRSIMGYTGVWERDQDLVTGELRITGGQFRVDIANGRTLVGAGVRADGIEFVGSGDQFQLDLCDAFAGQ